MKKIIQIALTILILAAAYSAAHYFSRHRTTVPMEHNTLIVGTSDDYQPYSFTKGGVTQGFDMDLTKEIARRLGLEYKLKVMAFDVLLLELARGDVHVVASGITPTVERERIVSFSSPYCQGDPLLILSSNEDCNLNSVKELHGKTIVVNEGFSSDFYLSKIPELELLKVETVAEAILAVKRNKADAFVVAQSAIEPFFQNHSKDEFCIGTLPDITESCALALAKARPDLLEKINTILVELQEDGTLKDLKRRWGIA